MTFLYPPPKTSSLDAEPADKITNSVLFRCCLIFIVVLLLPFVPLTIREWHQVNEYRAVQKLPPSTCLVTSVIEKPASKRARVTYYHLPSGRSDHQLVYDSSSYVDPTQLEIGDNITCYSRSFAPEDIDPIYIDVGYHLEITVVLTIFATGLLIMAICGTLIECRDCCSWASCLSLCSSKGYQSIV
jgi:hypothetical protein